MHTDTPSIWFTDDHRACDRLWSELERAADRGDAAGTAALWPTFAQAMERHFGWEEQVLFPALEEATGMRGGPTAVMRHEHAQMRRLLEQMASARAQGDLTTLLDHGETLVFLVAQHNAKEENILYPLADRALSAAWPGLRSQLTAPR